mmetsp:Transcript_17148/g.30818  ORF Transcript_17148/g.30818 Transcript_17148/m.30818 type:complete len:173 (+) Transcript_17148:4047-4565(+)|eukprot:CAMPEP_0204900868 /NCGR_PEP_ID=MMETSP1397-20131031/2730_1 /ASSEMBLY_ACC=CAM_ASM_000891 /TAXON_ID=49980 /ORGANISM="Climacostomum Climacostomum virens, Strain Stock W-24" /LENGTH=172 /DNA_ID=CAMNT_0052069099 /DNA_START=825 /DNA_END=1343 /DNA_ORIENTATION=-
MKEKPVVIEYSSLRFLLIGETKPGEEDELLPKLAYRGTKHLVILEPTDINLTRFENVTIQHLYIAHGTFPSSLTLRQWLSSVRSVFYPHNDIEHRENRDCIALLSNSVVGVGTLLVAIAMIESGLEKQAAIDLIRLKLSTAFSDSQIHYLLNYQPGMLRMRSPQCCGGCSVF